MTWCKITISLSGTYSFVSIVFIVYYFCSLLPAKYHPLIGQVCIDHKKDMVTASYISPAMAALHSSAETAEVRLLNEIGLDPGLDHMTAMAIIDDVHAQNGRILSFVSYCGGLPAPEDSTNPLGYKFSWSPKGVLLATLNAAQFKEENKVIKIAPGSVMQAAKPLPLFTGLSLEGFPNRDALQYEKLYHLERDTPKDMFRGTLRYKGYAELMSAFNTIGLLNEDPARMRDFSLVNHWVNNTYI